MRMSTVLLLTNQTNSSDAVYVLLNTVVSLTVKKLDRAVARMSVRPTTAITTEAVRTFARTSTKHHWTTATTFSCKSMITNRKRIAIAPT